MALKGPVILFVVLTTALAGSGCNSLLGNDDHSVAGPLNDGPLSVDAGPSPHPDAGSSPGAGDAARAVDAATMADGSADDAGEAGSPGGPVTPSGGGIVSLGRIGASGTLPDGSVASVTDDGFEFGETLCNGSTCVTGALTP